ncbi:MAG: GDYXXLXY domain-containing protein [Ardenticatenales bacterium]
MSTRRLLGALGLVAALVFANAQLVGLERLMGGAGRQVLMPLAPFDPLSFVQGRYVALHYRLDGPQSLIVTPVTVDGEVVERWRMWPRTGRMAVLVDADGKAAAIRLHDETAKLAPGEVLWRYRKAGAALIIGSEAWFCPEERCAEFERDAAFGVFKVDDTGRVILVGLADAGGAIMATPPPRWWTGQRVDATATPTAP